MLGNISFDRPICFLDLDTTGLDFKKDEIIQISINKVNPDKTTEKYTQRFKPTVDIQQEAFEKHGISKTELENEPNFKEKTTDIVEFLGDNHIAGFSINYFHLPFLITKLYECGIMFNYKKNRRRIIDVKGLYQKAFNPNSIDFAYKYLMGSEPNKAIDSNVKSVEILERLLPSFDDISDINDIDNLNNNFDLSGKIIIENDNVVFNFGKHKGKKVLYVLDIDRSYVDWVMQSDIPIDTKLVLKGLIMYYDNKKKK